MDKSQYRLVQQLMSCLDGREKYLISLRYIQGEKWENICVKMGYEWRQVHRIHAQALKQIIENMA